MQHFYQDIPGGFWFRQAYYRILHRLPHDRPTTIVEVGTCHGRSAAFLGVSIKNIGVPAHVHCVDNFCWSPVPFEGTLQSVCEKNLAPLSDIITIHPIPSLEAAKKFRDDSVDFVWIDADHSYKGVKDDIAAWWPKIKRGGAMGGDDFPMAGVKVAVEESGPYELIQGIREDAEYSGPWESWWREKP